MNPRFGFFHMGPDMIPKINIIVYRRNDDYMSTCLQAPIGDDIQTIHGQWGWFLFGNVKGIENMNRVFWRKKTSLSSLSNMVCNSLISSNTHVFLIQSGHGIIS